MTDESVASQVRAEHVIVNTLSQNLKGLIGTLPQASRDAWLHELRRDFSRYRVHLKNHFAAEEDGGFMVPVLERRPTLAPEVEHLKREHAELVQILDLVQEELEQLSPDDKLIIEDVCLRIQHLISALEHHEEQEELIVTFVFSQDLGGRN